MKGLDPERVVLLSTNATPELAQTIASILGLSLGNRICGRFNDSEVRVQIGMDVPIRNSWVFIIGSTQPPAEHWLEVMLLADAARRAGAYMVVWVGPYVGYGRQDRKIDGHDPISAAVTLDMVIGAGVQQIIAVDLHSGQSQGFIKQPLANLWGRKLVLRRALQKLGYLVDDHYLEGLASSVALGGPDPGAYKLCWHYASKFGCILIGGLKTRPEPGVSEMVLVGGEKVAGLDLIALDDMSDTCGTLIDFSDLAKGKGANSFIAAFTHPVLSQDGKGIDAIKKMEQSSIDTVITTDTIPLRVQSHKIEIVSVADEIAESIYRTVTGKSVSNMATQF